MKRTYPLISIICLVFVVFANALPLSVISSEGVIKSKPTIAKYLENKLTQSATPKIVSILDCSSPLLECKQINHLFDADFTPTGSGLSLTVIDERLITIRSCFESLLSPKFCGVKAAEVYGSLEFDTIVLFKADDATEVFTMYQQLFRKILHFSSSLAVGKKMKCCILMKTSLPADFETMLNEEWGDLDLQGKLSDKIDLTVFQSNDINELKRDVSLFVNQSPLPSFEAASFAERLTTAWSTVPILPRPLLNKIDEINLYNLEKAYVRDVQQIEMATVQMQKRVSSGKVLINFPQRIQKLLQIVLADFNIHVSGSTMIRERAEKSKNLKDHVMRAATSLFDQQVVIKENEVMEVFRKELSEIYSEGNYGDLPETKVAGDDEEATPATISLSNSVNQLIRKTSLDFKLSVKELEEEGLGLVVNKNVIDEFTVKIETFARQFPESNEAKLLDIKKMEKEVSKTPRKQKRSKFGAIAASLSLVGMLRPAGFGNLQGFIGYATSLLGFPTDFLIGFQNDGESAEILGDDREYPFLRLQPKFNFEIDL